MKKSVLAILSVLLAVFLLITAAYAYPYNDVKEDEWYTEAVKWCEQKKLMFGVGANCFAPSELLTRAQLTYVLCIRAAGNIEETKNVKFFDDVSEGAWYYDVVQWAADKDIVNGVGNCLFDPDGIVTREQLATFLYSMTGTLTWKIENEEGTTTLAPFETEQRTDLSKYSDTDEISVWAEEALSWAVAIGAISGTSETTLSPRGYATRAQLALIMQKYSAEYSAEYATFENNIEIEAE